MISVTDFSESRPSPSFESANQKTAIDVQISSEPIVSGQDNQAKRNHPKAKYWQETEKSKADKRDPDQLTRQGRERLEPRDELVDAIPSHYFKVSNKINFQFAYFFWNWGLKAR